MDSLPDSLSSGNCMFFAVFLEAAVSFRINPYCVIDTLGMINLWTPRPGTQFITYFLQCNKYNICIAKSQGLSQKNSRLTNGQKDRCTARGICQILTGTGSVISSVSGVTAHSTAKASTPASAARRRAAPKVGIAASLGEKAVIPAIWITKHTWAS